MTPSRIEIEIGELVVYGMSYEDAAGLPAVIEEHLAALASGTALAGAGAPSSAGTATSTRGLGAQVAHAVWDRLPAVAPSVRAPSVGRGNAA